MNVELNGETTTLELGTTVADVVQAFGRDASSVGIAVAVNGEVVRRAEWSSRQLSEHDRVEVLSAVQGG